MASPGDDAVYAIATSVPELNVTSSVLTAAARHLGEHCKSVNVAYTKCKVDNGGDPKKCAIAGAQVTQCTRDFFTTLKNHCGDTFDAQWKCLDVNNLEYSKCRSTQSKNDDCVFDKMGLNGSFATYDTSRSYSSYHDA